MVALLVFIMATLEIAKKHFWTEKVHLAVTFPKMTVDEPKFNIQNNRTSHAFTC